MRAALGALVGVLLVVLLPQSAAAATTRYVLHTAAYPVEDACNDHVVVLHGDFVITQTTSPAADGGTTTRSRIVSTNLAGLDEDGLAYRAVDAERSFVHERRATGTAFFVDAHATLLLPQTDAPKMLLVSVFQETVAPDGTPSVRLDRSYTVCLRARETRG